jgi:hypothetical protein
MYVRGYLQGSENGRVVTIEETACSMWRQYYLFELVFLIDTCIKSNTHVH